MPRLLTGSPASSSQIGDIPYGVVIGLFPGFYPGGSAYPGSMQYGQGGLYPGFYPGDGEFPGAGSDLLGSPITPSTLTGVPA